MDGVPRYPPGRRQQDDPGHHGSAQDARLHTGQEAEAHQRPDHQPTAAPGPDTGRRREPGHARDHHGDVRAADRGQVRQPGGPHGLPQVPGQEPRVTGDETDREPRRHRRQVPDGRRPDAPSDLLQDPEAGPRWTEPIPRRRRHLHGGVTGPQPGPEAVLVQRPCRDPTSPAGSDDRWPAVTRPPHERPLTGAPRTHPVDARHEPPALRRTSGLTDDRHHARGRPATDRELPQGAPLDQHHPEAGERGHDQEEPGGSRRRSPGGHRRPDGPAESDPAEDGEADRAHGEPRRCRGRHETPEVRADDSRDGQRRQRPAVRPALSPRGHARPGPGRSARRSRRSPAAGGPPGRGRDAPASQ